MKSETEQELIQRIQNGDATALTPYIKAQNDHLLAVIAQKMGAALKSKIEPQDILQEVLVSAFNSYDELDWSSRDPFVWLCQLADRRIIDAHRRYVSAEKRSAKREVSLNLKSSSAADAAEGEMIDLLVKSMTMPSAAFSRDQKAIRMQAAIAELPELGREAVRLRYVEGWASKEIAKELGKSDAAIRVLLSRTLKKLHEMIGDDPHFQDYVSK
jgi:RNA polymerase sigma-70 factor (ECF subfamily)